MKIFLDYERKIFGSFVKTTFLGSFERMFFSKFPQLTHPKMGNHEEKRSTY